MEGISTERVGKKHELGEVSMPLCSNPCFAPEHILVIQPVMRENSTISVFLHSISPT